MARKIESYRAHPPEKFHIPAVAKKSTFVDKFGSLNPSPKIKDDTDVAFMARFGAWRASSPHYQAGSVPEFIVWEYLTTVKKWRDGSDFKYQYDLLGGRTRYGGFVVDFFIDLGQMAWNVQGLRYHLEQARDRAKLILQEALLAKRGYTVLNLWEDDLLERPTYTMEAALHGQSTNRHSDDAGFLR